MEPPEEPTEEETLSAVHRERCATCGGIAAPSDLDPETGRPRRTIDWAGKSREELIDIAEYSFGKTKSAGTGEERYRHQARDAQAKVADRDRELADLKSELDAAKAKSMHPADWRTVALEFAIAAEGLAPGKSAKEIAAFFEPRADIRDGVIRIAGASGGKFLPSVRLALLALDPDLLAPIHGSGGRAPNPYVATPTVNPIQKALDSQKAYEEKGKELGVRK